MLDSTVLVAPPVATKVIIVLPKAMDNVRIDMKTRNNRMVTLIITAYINISYW